MTKWYFFGDVSTGQAEIHVFVKFLRSMPTTRKTRKKVTKTDTSTSSNQVSPSKYDDIIENDKRECRY